MAKHYDQVDVRFRPELDISYSHGATFPSKRTCVQASFLSRPYHQYIRIRSMMCGDPDACTHSIRTH